MKTVFSNHSDVAHIWANKQQQSAKYSGGNFYFDGDTIYSYGGHFPIAKHIEFKGKQAVLFTKDTYSNTTAKHIHCVRQACNHLNVIYCLNVDYYASASGDAWHAKNFHHWLNEAEAIATKLSVARKPEVYLNQLSAVAEQVSKYADFFEISVPQSLKTVLSVGNKEQYIKYTSDKSAVLEAERKKQEQKDKKQLKKALTDWTSGKIVHIYKTGEYDYLRQSSYEGGKPCIETTQRVKIPINTAKRFYDRIINNLLKKGDFISDQYHHKYEVSEVGDIIQIGCHTFQRDYILKFGKKVFADKVA